MDRSWSVELLVTFARTGVVEVGLNYPGSTVGEYLKRSTSVPEGTFSKELTSNILRVDVLSETGK